MDKVATLGVGLLGGASLGLLTARVGLSLYDWFLRPLGAPELSYWHMYGLLTVGSFFWIWKISGTEIDESNTDAGHMASQMAAKALMYLWLWGVGAIVHALMVSQ